MKRGLAAIAATSLLVGGLVALAATSAYATEQEPEVCYEEQEGVAYDLQRSDWVAATPGTPAVWAPFGDFSQTRSTGHYASEGSDLHIWTEGATSTDKVAGYHATDIPLSSVTSVVLDYTANVGIVPGTQLVVDINDDGVPDGILVGEPVYGDAFWLSNSATAEFKALAPHTGGGYGSEWYGTLTEWGTSVPGATVIAVGFSLGSGVLGDGTVHSLVVNGTTYNFSQLITPEVPPVPEHYTDWYVVSSGEGLELPDGREDGEEFTTDALYRYVVTGEATIEVEVECPPPSTEEPTPSPEPTPTQTPTPVVPTSTNTGSLADTGADLSPMIWTAVVLLVGGLTVGTIGALRQRKHTQR